VLPSTAREDVETDMAPRQIVPGSTYLVTRRCSQRQFLLLPSKTVNRVFLCRRP